MNKLRNLPVVVKISITIILFLIIFMAINEFIIGEYSDPIKEAYNERDITLVTVIIVFTLYMLFFHKKKMANNK